MIAGITLEESIAAFGGKRGATRTKDLVNALRKQVINCGDPPLTRIKWQRYPEKYFISIVAETLGAAVAWDQALYRAAFKVN
jgi:hypothetical protein